LKTWLSARENALNPDDDMEHYTERATSTRKYRQEGELFQPNA
jgi:hypothetical protein